MITNQLLRPASIVVVGASNNVHKPGGAILRNLINGGYTGELRAVNPKETEVQGVTAYADVKDIPDTELAILAIPAQMCPDAVEVLAAEKQVRAFIILSAGFGEETHEGALLEDRILETVNKYGASLIGPNCIGLMNTWHHSVQSTHSAIASSRSRFDIQLRCDCRFHFGKCRNKRFAVQFCLVCGECQADRCGRCAAIYGREFPGR